MDQVRAWIDGFRFTIGVTPLSGFTAPVIAVCLYSAMCLYLPKYMASRKPAKIPGILFAHNSFLSVASLLLLVFQVWELASEYKGLGYLICSPVVHDNGRLHLIWYLNYLLKYYELLDTFFLIIRKKPVIFLHKYHHPATLMLTWIQQREHSTAQWVPIVLNLFVHVLMYYYYAVTVLKIREQRKPKNEKFPRVWWKKYLTGMQVIQFTLDVAAISYGYAIFLRNGMDPQACYGTNLGAVTGLGLLTSYLVLFLIFFRETYRPRESPEAVLKKTS